MADTASAAPRLRAGEPPATQYGAFDGASGSRSRIASAIFSAVMIVGALRLPLTIRGMIDASTTLRPSTPWTRPPPSVTARGSSAGPIAQVYEGW